MTQGKLNEKLPTFLEVCEGAQASDNPMQYLKDAVAKDKRVMTVLAYCVQPAWKLPLPEGTPPYQPATYPAADLAEIGILHQHDKLKGLFNPNMKAYKREELWVNWLERMFDKEAQIMNMIKDQTLHAMYPALTKILIAEALGYPLDQYRALCAKYNRPAE
jgi:hypothetical protein